MESKKSQGPSRVSLVASAVFLCIVLVGAAVFFRDEKVRTTSRRSSPAASALQPLLDRCEEEPKVELVDGFTRKTCTTRKHPVFMLHLDTSGDIIERVGLMVPMPGLPGELEERKQVGLEMFGLVAGVAPESFLPPEMQSDIGVRETRVVLDDLVYITQPVANVGLVFAVRPADEPPSSQK